MIEIGGMPILWHIMKIYSFYGFHEFIVCLGYKGYVIKEFFSNYFLHKSDVTFDLKNNSIEIHNTDIEPWKVTLVDTGKDSMTGGRIKRIQPYVENETFMLTYGDGLSTVDIHQLLKFHEENKKNATVTIIQPSGRFGAITLSENQQQVTSFEEKPKGDGYWINGGYFVLEPAIFDYIENDNTIWERAPLENLAKNNELSAFQHYGFWKPMDTLKDKQDLEQLWLENKAPWKFWK